ncbi:MAG: hypothetical protein ACYCVB_10795 [Bacilli bacterium]
MGTFRSLTVSGLLTVALATVELPTLFPAHPGRPMTVRAHQAPAPRDHGAATGAWPAPPVRHGSVMQRKFPYPYRAMLAIASDSDGMTLRKFILIHRYLNTFANTSMGRGLGLDIADSFFFFVGTDRPGAIDARHTPWQDQMSYFYRLSTDDLHNAQAIVHFSRVGWIDSLHGLGDFSMVDQTNTLFERRYAETARRAMRENNLRYTVWINHGNRSNVANFGSPESTYQQGDLTQSPYYVADLMVQSGVKYIWTRRDREFGLKSMLYPITLRDGVKRWGFYRYTDDGYDQLGNLLWNWNPAQLAWQLRPDHLRMIETRHLYAIVAQHLGGNDTENPVYGANLLALINLAHACREGRILVARTSRLLQYNEVQQWLHYTVRYSGVHADIDIDQVRDPVLGWRQPAMDDLRGVTFYSSSPRQTRVIVSGRVVQDVRLQYNQADYTGKPSISIPWWPANTLDNSLDSGVASDARDASGNERGDGKSSDPVLTAPKAPTLPRAPIAPPIWIWSEDQL